MYNSPGWWKDPGEHAYFTGCFRKWEVLFFVTKVNEAEQCFCWVDQVHSRVSRLSKGPEGCASALRLSFCVQHSNKSIGGSLCVCVCSPQPSGLTLCNVDWRLLLAGPHDSRALVFLRITAHTHAFIVKLSEESDYTCFRKHISQCAKKPQLFII